MKNWLKIIGFVGLGFVCVFIMFFVWSWLKYAKHIIATQPRVTISLPFTSENDDARLIPMGEKIGHPCCHGHPGIDFQWNHNVPLIAVADGKITGISREEDEGQPVWYIELAFGGYLARYKELDTYPTGLHRGSTVRRGDIIGYPHGSSHPGDRNHATSIGYQLHWEFAYDTPFSFLPWVDRLCPLTYFDADSRRRIDTIWDKVTVEIYRDKNLYPNICNGWYYGHDQ